jgi:adenosylhomocysteinase
LGLLKQGNIIPVIHILPDAIPFLYALEKTATVPFVIPKPKSINTDVESSLDVEIKHLTRSEVDKSNFYEEIPKQKTVFIDIGGYFSNSTSEISNILGNIFCGVVEDTENGLQKYLAKDIKFPLISVARSPLKENEDYMVGRAIGYSIERMLREHNILLNGLKFGVIGYGKIGRSVAKTAKDNQSFVFVNDIDSVRLTHAYSHGFNAKDKDELIASSDVLCVATGKVSLTATDFQKIKNGCWVFSVTSSDDSIDVVWLELNYNKTKISEHVYKYSKDENYFYLVNGGNTINFIHGTTVGDFILLVQAELLLSANRLLDSAHKPGIQELGGEERKMICDLWLEHFS